MIANTAFLALITVFLVAGWLAGELSFLAPYKGPLFARHGWLIARNCARAVLQSERVLLPRRAVAIPSGYRQQAAAHGQAAWNCRRRNQRHRYSFELARF